MPSQIAFLHCRHANTQQSPANIRNQTIPRGSVNGRRNPCILGGHRPSILRSIATAEDGLTTDY